MCQSLAVQFAGNDPPSYSAAGNFNEVVEDLPYLQIGEHKCGKPIIERVITPEAEMQDAVICAMLSMDTTVRSNLSVGTPLDLAVTKKNALQFDQRRRIAADDLAFHEFSARWSEELRRAFGVMRQMNV